MTVKNLFKYQVRLLARSDYVNIPSILSERQPQPGPSGAVRIVDEINLEKINLWQEINHYVENQLSKLNPKQYFAILMPNQYIQDTDYINNIKSRLLEIFGHDYELNANVFKFPTVGINLSTREYSALTRSETGLP